MQTCNYLSAMMYALANFFYHFSVKRIQIIWPATGNQSVINYNLFVNPIDTGVFKVGFAMTGMR